MKTFSRILMAVVLTISSSMSFAATNDVAARLNRAELEVERDTLRAAVHKNMVQFKALEDEANDADLKMFYEANSRYFYTTLSGIASVATLISAGVAVSINPYLESQATINAYWKAAAISALLAAGFFTAATQQDDQPIYAETLSQLKFMDGQSKREFAKYLSNEANQNVAKLKAVEAKLEAQ